MIQEKKLGKGVLQVVNIHKCEVPTPDAARNAGAVEGSTWTCDECQKMHRLQRFDDQREGVWWDWRSV